MTDCIFCKIIAGTIPSYKVYEDEKYLGILDINPIQPGHTLLIAKQHVELPFDLDDTEYSDYLLAARRLVPVIRKAMGSAKVGLVIEGLEVPHAHIKLIPITHPGDLAQSNARSASKEELGGVAERIRKSMPL